MGAQQLWAARSEIRLIRLEEFVEAGQAAERNYRSAWMPLQVIVPECAIAPQKRQTALAYR